jgi:hypothetical protein
MENHEVNLQDVSIPLLLQTMTGGIPQNGFLLSPSFMEESEEVQSQLLVYKFHELNYG